MSDPFEFSHALHTQRDELDEQYQILGPGVGSIAGTRRTIFFINL